MHVHNRSESVVNRLFCAGVYLIRPYAIEKAYFDGILMASRVMQYCDIHWWRIQWIKWFCKFCYHFLFPLLFPWIHKIMVLYHKEGNFGDRKIWQIWRITVWSVPHAINFALHAIKFWSRVTCILMYIISGSLIVSNESVKW